MQKIASRIAYMDALRAVLMLLGVVIHASQIYNPEKGWLIYSVHSNFIFEILIDFISSFRMPAFFIVSGYFSFLLLQKLSIKDFFVGRFERLIIPLVIGVLTLNIPIAVLLSNLGWVQTDLSTFLMEGGWRQHLWFLGNLFIYSVVLIILFTSNALSFVFSGLSSFYKMVGVVSIAFLLPLFHVFILSLNKFGIPIYNDWLGLSLYDLMYYFPFFILGAYLRYDVNFFEGFTSFRTLTYIFIMYLFMLVVKSSVYVQSVALVASVFDVYNKAILAWLLAMTCFFLFKLFVDAESKFWKELASSSYSVYIFHQPVIILIGLALVELQLQPLVGFSIVVILTFVITMLLHYKVIKRFVFLECIYNGKRMRNS